MSMNELEARMKNLLELKRMMADLEAEISAEEDAIKAEMGDREEIVAGPFKATWKPVTSSRLDSKALVAFLGKEALQPYYKTTTTRRFCIG